MEEEKESRAKLAEEILGFIKTTRLKTKEKKEEKEIASKNLHKFYNGREIVLNAFMSKIFLRKSEGTGILNNDHSHLKILTPKQMLQRFPIAFVQVKARNKSEYLLIEIQQIIYSLYQTKENTKKVCNNLVKSL